MPPAESPSGNVTVRFQEKNCTASLKAVQATTPEQRFSSGTCVIQNVSAGQGNATADYGGDNNYGPATISLMYTVAPANTANGQGPIAPDAPTLTLDPGSDSGISNTDAKTNDDTPTLRIGLTRSGANAHAAGDVVTIFLRDVNTSRAVGNVTLTAGDINRGEATVTTSSLGADGPKRLVARVSRNAAIVNFSAPLSMLLDRTPPELTSASINGATVRLNYVETGSGLDPTPPTLSLFALITDARTTNAPVRGTVNQTNNTVSLDLAAPVTNQTPVRLNYTSGPNGVRDIAGNLAVSVNTREVKNLTPAAGGPGPVVDRGNGGNAPKAPQPSGAPSQPLAVKPPPTSNVVVTNITPSQPAAIDSTSARFNSPAGIVRDRQGNLYVTDQNNFTVRKIAANGAVTTVAGKAGESVERDGPLGTSRFLSPGAIAVDQAGNLYVLDNRDLRKIDTNGNVTTMVTTPQQPLLGGPNTFGLPAGLAVDSTGNVFVADYLVGAIWKVTPDGKVSRFVTIGQGIANLSGAGPSGIAIDAANNLYVSDLPYSLNAGGFSSIHKVTPTGTVTLLYGPTIGLVNARGIGIDAKDDLYFNENLVIVKIATTAGTVTAYQLPASPSGGSVSAASIALNPESGAVYFTDSAKHTVSRLDPDGKITVIAGRAGEAGAVDIEK